MKDIDIRSVWETQGLRPVEKLVFLAIAYLADENGLCTASNDEIARLTCQSPSMVADVKLLLSRRNRLAILGQPTRGDIPMAPRDGGAA